MKGSINKGAHSFRQSFLTDVPQTQDTVIPLPQSSVFQRANSESSSKKFSVDKYILANLKKITAQSNEATVATVESPEPEQSHITTREKKIISVVMSRPQSKSDIKVIQYDREGRRKISRPMTQYYPSEKPGSTTMYLEVEKTKQKARHRPLSFISKQKKVSEELNSDKKKDVPFLELDHKPVPTHSRHTTLSEALAARGGLVPSVFPEGPKARPRLSLAKKPAETESPYMFSRPGSMASFRAI